VRAYNRVFLEIARFDRVGRRGWRGVASLTMLDAEFVGRMLSWSDTGAELERQGVIYAAILTEIRWRELFGKLIANSDMHFGNLSVFVKGTRATGLAPAYDMVPMSYAAQQAHIGEARFEPPLPSAADAAIWPTAYRAALDFWGRVACHRLVSGPFRKLARKNHARLLESRDVAALPRHSKRGWRPADRRCPSLGVSTTTKDTVGKQNTPACDAMSARMC
jgi:hypothetical protein